MLLTIFTTILLTISHLHSTLASPVVSEGGVVAGQSPNLPRSLAKRYVPVDQQCSNAVYWVSRACNPAYGDRFWVDSCSGPGVADGQIVSTINGLCKGNTICSPTVREHKDTIECIPRPVVFANSGVAGQQSGVTEVGATVHNNKQYRVSVTLAKTITLAAVSAIIEGKH